MDPGSVEDEYCITPSVMERKPLLYSTANGNGSEEIEKPKPEPPREAMPWLFERPNYVHKGFLKQNAPIAKVFAVSPAAHHNETVNIYSHLLPAGIFIFFGARVLLFPPSHMTSADIIVSTIYAAGTTTCFILSALFHARQHVNRATHWWTSQFDIIGIVSLMSSAAIPMIYYGLYGHTTEQRYYFAIVPLLALGCCAALLVPKGSNGPVAALRIFMFAGLALPGVVAIMHGRQLSTHAGEKPITLGWIAGTALLNASGALMYASKFPEKYFEGFSIYGASHQIFHLLIVASSLVFWHGLMNTIEALRYRLA